MKWLQDKELTKPGWYWKCWRGRDGEHYNLGLVELDESYIKTVGDIGYDYASVLSYYGPLEAPSPPSGDVWGV